MSILIENGITIGHGVRIGDFNAIYTITPIVEEDLTTLIVTETGDQIIEEY